MGDRAILLSGTEDMADDIINLICYYATGSVTENIGQIKKRCTGCKEYAPFPAGIRSNVRIGLTKKSVLKIQVFDWNSHFMEQRDFEENRGTLKKTEGL